MCIVDGTILGEIDASEESCLKNKMPQPGLEPDSSVPALLDTTALAHYIAGTS
jgi:hypothetical protein